MTWKEINKASLVGELNVHRFVQNGNDTLYLQRIPKENYRILTLIHHEYGFMGFNDAGLK